MTDTHIANPKWFQEVVIATGDQGSITFRKADGVVVERDFYSISDRPELHGYPFILRADPATLLYPDMDILHVGYWYQDARGQLAYEPAINTDENLAPPFDNTEPVAMKPFDLEKAKAGASVQTRDGRKARIICFTADHPSHPIVALVANREGEEIQETYTREGRYYDALDAESAFDLFMAPVKREGWVNIYSYDRTGIAVHPSRSLADKSDVRKVRIACVRIGWEE